MKSKEFVLFLLLQAVCGFLFAQQSPAVELSPVQVLDSVELSVRDISVISFDSLNANGFQGYDAGDLISASSTVFVKDYGPGSSASLSYRGGTAYHTKVYWEGISIDNPMLGQQDLSLIQPDETMSLRFYRGGHSLALGTGGFGGILNIEQVEKAWDGLKISLRESYGSFQTNQHHSSIMVGNGKLKFESSFTYLQSENNFNYLDYASGDGYKNRRNAAYAKWQWMPRLSFRTGDHDFFVSYWHLNSGRQIPATIGVKDGDARQQDEWNRFMAGWQVMKNRWKFHLNTAYINDLLYYDSEFLATHSVNTTRASRSVAALEFHLSEHWSSETQAKFDHTRAFSSNYLLSPLREEAEAFESLSFHTEHILASVKFRYYAITGKTGVILPAVSLKNVFRTGWLTHTLHAGFSTNVRYPSFNELYWQTSSALSLNEERSWNTEMGIKLERSEGKVFGFQFQLTGFQSKFDNLILWLPDNSGTWRPHNQKDAVNYGLEANLSGDLRLGKWKVSLNSGYGYTVSLVRNKNDEDEQRLQQIYTPLNKLFYGLRIEQGILFAGFHQTITDKIYITTDNKTYLPMSSPAGAEIGMNRTWKRVGTTLKFEVRNLLNENYQYVANMPMPLRHYCITLLIQYNQ